MPRDCYFRGGASFAHNFQLFYICSNKQTKQFDGNLPSELEEFLENDQGVETVEKLGEENNASASDSSTKDLEPYHSSGTRETTMVVSALTLSELYMLFFQVIVFLVYLLVFIYAFFFIYNAGACHNQVSKGGVFEG